MASCERNASMRRSTAASVCGERGGGAGWAIAGAASLAGGGPAEGATAAGGGIGAVAAAGPVDCARLAHEASSAASAAPNPITRIAKRPSIG
jgi:hypothetical protein